MARIVISTLGSTGDHFPFIALGQGLKARGHSVLFAVSASVHPTLKKAGLDFVPCGKSMSEDDARQRVELFDGSKPMEQMNKLMFGWLMPAVAENYQDLLAACKGADALIATTIQFAAPMVHEKLGLHWVTVSLTPGQFQSNYDTPVHWPLSRFTLFNRLGWLISKGVIRRKYLPALNRIRAELGFGALKGAPAMEDFSRELVLLASSPHFTPPRPDWNPCVKQTGYWFYDGKEQSDWKPPAELQAFVENGAKPLVLSLGSMVQKDPRRIVQIHAEATARLKQRLIIQQGWAQLAINGVDSGLAPGDLIGAGFLPHEWLFSLARAVIHHGGAGTTARALRHGCPMLIESHGFDQPYNARCIKALGAGTEIPSHKLSVTGIESALRHVLSPEVKLKTEEIGIKIRAEDGVVEACLLIEDMLGEGGNLSQGAPRNAGKLAASI